MRSSSPTATPITSSASTTCGDTTHAAAADACYGDARHGRRHPQDVLLRVRSRDAARRGAAAARDCSSMAGPFCLGRQEIVPVPVLHGQRPILGLRVGGFAYLTDCSAIPEASWPLLEGLDVLGARRAARASAPDAFLAEPRPIEAARRIGAAADLLHAHVPRPAARGDLRAPARRGSSWPMMGLRDRDVAPRDRGPEP